MFTPDLALLTQLLSSTDYTSADSVELTAAELHNRAYLVKVAIEYVRALMDLHVTLDRLPPDAVLLPTVAAFLVEVQR